MKISRRMVCMAACALLLAGQANAGDRGTAAEAVALVKKAGEYLKANGKEKAFAEFNNPNGAFRDRDLYIFAYDFNGVTLAHGTNPKMIGKDLIEMKDANGVYIIKEFIKTAKGSGKGWVEYKWPNPVTNALESKSSYIERNGDLLIGCGVYK